MQTAVSKIELFPVSLNLIDMAVAIRKETYKNPILADQTSSSDAAQTKIDTNPTACLPETSYLMLLSTYNPTEEVPQSSPLWEADFQRTGRWTKEEAEYADFLFKTFEEGTVALPQGLRLKDFLCQMLLSKGSRLTKKFKNARLSVRTYEIKNLDSTGREYDMLSSLQEKFLQSIQDEASQLEIRFFLDKTWKALFSDLCIQTECKMLDAAKWFESVEEMENKATQTEEMIRTIRRKTSSMSRYTTKDTATSSESATDTDKHGIKRSESTGGSVSASVEPKSSSTIPPVLTNQIMKAAPESISEQHLYGLGSGDIAKEVMVHPASHDDEKLPPMSANDFANVFEDKTEHQYQTTILKHQEQTRTSGPFVKAIRALLELRKLPFQMVELWVPSYGSPLTPNRSDMLLYHGGYECRRDLDPSFYDTLIGFGNYSSMFSFRPGSGFPGRVYQTQEPQWESGIDTTTMYERSEGFKAFGIKTMVGIPLKFKNVVSVVVVMYGLTNVAGDSNMIRSFHAELTQYTPLPKWTLVVDTDAAKEERAGGFASGDQSVADQETDIATSNKRIRIDNVAVGGSISGTAHPSTQQQFQQQRQHLTTTSGAQSLARRDTASPLSLATAIDDFSDPRKEELYLANILGHNMPFTGPNSQHNTEQQLENYISLRLLLLQDPTSRTIKENNAADLIRQSYRGYRLNDRWSDGDLAALIVKDWIHLRMSIF